MSFKSQIYSPLEDVVTLQRGFDLPSQARKDGIVPVVASTGINGYHNETKVKGPGVVIGRSGSIGGGQYIVDDFWPLNTTLWVSNFKNHDRRFVYYLLRSIDFTQFNAGVGVPTLNRNHIASIRVRNFSLESERRIADILSSYDNLIDNNARRISLLERTARLLFEEWFVRLRFPGHDSAKIADGVPEGWGKERLSNLCESINYGHTASATRDLVGPKFLRITDIVPKTIEWDDVPYCEIDDKKKAQFSLREGDIVVARTGATVGHAKRINKRNPESVFASYLVRLRIKAEIDNIYVGMFVESEIYRNFIVSNIGGSAQPNANAKVLSSMEILLPPKSLCELYRRIASPLIDQMELLNISNAKLMRARDLLLPRLMDGRIAV